MRKISLILTSIVLSVLAQDQATDFGQSRVTADPALPYYDWKACPFEGCTYREWTVLKAAVVYETWNKNSQRIARIAVRVAWRPISTWAGKCSGPRSNFNPGRSDG